eukprot:IDg12214t1
MDKEQKKVNLQPKAAGQRRTRSTCRILPRMIGQNLSDHISEVEMAAAQNVAEQSVAQATERWVKQQVQPAARHNSP